MSESNEVTTGGEEEEVAKGEKAKIEVFLLLISARCKVSSLAMPPARGFWRVR